MTGSTDPSGFIKIDFARFFPHKFWISTWGKDQSYPDGFRYKILTVRDETQCSIEMVLLLEHANGNKEEMHREHVRAEAIDGYAKVFWKGLEDEYGIEFEEQDFSGSRTIEEFDEAVARFGWSGKEPESA